MPTAEQVIRRLKTAGFKFDHETEHVRVFKGEVNGRAMRVQVQRKRELEEITARSILKQAGLTHSGTLDDCLP